MLFKTHKHINTTFFALAMATIFSVPAFAETKPHWSYDGNYGPENWGSVSSKFDTCDLGHMQSPININKTLNAQLPDLDISYQSAPLTVLNNGHTIQVNYPKGSKFDVGGKTFNLLQVHFHTPSEYAINGSRSDMSAHFVHQDKKGDLGVIGVLIKKGKENSAAKIIWDHLPMQSGEPKTYNDVKINMADLLPEDKKYYRFMGSLTTPPCSENVHWYVMDTPIEFSSEQIEAFKAIFPMNARPLQKKNNRLIILDQ